MRKAVWVLTVVFLMSAVGSAAALNVGDSAPDFTVDSNQGTLKLSELLERGNVILAFYFAIFTPA